MARQTRVVLGLQKARMRAGLSVAELARRLDQTRQNMARYDEGRPMPLHLAKKAAQILATTINEILDIPLEGQNVATMQNIIPLSSNSHTPETSNTLPILGVAECGDGVMTVSNAAIDYIVPSAELASVKDAYALYVVGDSMYPVLKAGHLVEIHPHKPIIRDEDYVFYKDTGNGECHAMIKRLVRVTPDEWIVEQFTPQKQFALSRKEYPKAHRIIAVRRQG